MKTAATTAAASRAPRAPPSQGGGQARVATSAAGSTAASETHLRRRLADVEMRLRDVDDEAKRMQVHHEQELATLEKDNRRLRDRLEELRMEECMTPAEMRAMQVHVSLSHGTPGQEGESKLLGATSVKYQTAKAEVEAKRKECAQAERQLAEVRQQLTELRQQRQRLKHEMFATRASAGARMAAAQRYKVQVREQLRGLEEQVAREQERFSKMVVEAKRVRADIDALLVSETSNEKVYTRRNNALLDKRKEMAYLMELCNSLCEERQQVNAELQEMRAHLAQEDQQYEAAFQELHGVVEENTAVQQANREKMDELRRLITHTKAEREALEAQNAEDKAALERRQHRRVGRQPKKTSAKDTRDVSSNGSSSEHNFIRRPSDDSDNDEDAVSCNDNKNNRSGVETSFGSSNSDLYGNAQQMREFENYFQKLADIVQSDIIEDVVSFIDVAADERYRCFDEMNALRRDIAELTEERVRLKTQLTHGGSGHTAANSSAAVVPVSPTASVVALAELKTVNELSAAVASPRSVQQLQSQASHRVSDDAGTPFSPAGADVDQVTTARVARMKELQAELDKTRDAASEQMQQREECETVLSQVLIHVSDVFRGLGCSVAELRSMTGLEGVQQSTLLACLSIVEQRAEEYLLAYSRLQHPQHQQHHQEHPHSSLNVWGESTSSNGAPPAGSYNAARTVLRRPDLLPKIKGGSVVHVAPQQLPRSTDVASIVPHLGFDAGNTATLEELVEERPLSDAELREVVEAKRSQARRS
jgi:hypothetical protein